MFILFLEDVWDLVSVCYEGLLLSLWTQCLLHLLNLEQRKMATNSTGLTYGGQEKTPSLSGADADFAAEAGSPGGLFHLDYKRHDDLSNTNRI